MNDNENKAFELSDEEVENVSGGGIDDIDLYRARFIGINSDAGAPIGDEITKVVANSVVDQNSVDPIFLHN